MSSSPSHSAQLKSLEDFGYKFNSDGVLKKLGSEGEVTEEGFEFQVYETHKANQARYEAIGNVIDEEIYKLLESEGKLERVPVGGGKPQSFIFVSPEFSSRSKVVVMIHGSGVVRAGQWARRLIINEDLQKGTMLPYVKYIQDQGWGVAVLNTNHNTHLDSKETIPDNANPEEHADTVWEEVIKPSQAEKIVIISHSYGGVVTMDLAGRRQEDFLKRVCGVFMTDSVHYRLTGNQELDTKLEVISKNYVTSDKEVGTALTSSRRGVARYSAGHDTHEWTSWTARREIWRDLTTAFSQSDSDTQHQSGEL